MLYRIKILLLIFAAFNASCKKSGSEEVKPIIQDIEEWVFAPGQIDWENEYNITAQSEGILLDANFDIGTIVKKGLLIARIENPTSTVNMSTSQEQLTIANENLSPDAPAILQLKQNIIFAESKHQQDKLQAERYERLYKSESISKVEYENTKLNSENSLANLLALKKQYDIIVQQARQQNIIAKGQLKNTQIVQAYNQIKVINNGTIIKKFKSTGDFVRRGDIIAVVANPNNLQIVLNVDEGSISRVNVGQEVIVRLNSEKNKTYTGKVKEILPAFDASSQSFICKILLSDQLNPSKNIYATPLEGNIKVGEKKQALLIPRKYMGYGNKIQLKGKKSTSIVTPGIISTDYVEILEGLTVNDILIPLKP